jgi:Ala-tRNA(Pro) deacylase
MTYHQVSQQITELQSENGCWFETFEHAPVRTSEEAAGTRPGYSLHQGAKAIIVRIRRSESQKKFVVLVFPADLRFDKEKVKTLFGARVVRFATESEITTLTGGVQVGGVPPFGNLFGLEVVADPKLFENEKIVFNAGDRRFSVAMRSADYDKLVNPMVESIT